LDAAVDAVEKAATHAEALHASGAPDALRSLAGTLTKATGALEAAVPHVGHSPAEVMERVAVIRRLEEDGETLLETGLEQLFSGAPNALDVLRWKDVYEKLAHALGSCANAASALEQVTRSNA
jgi:uncharacterized protein Yka (UPF0111/DUF47 family)